MARENLATAAELLEDASERADGDLAERLRDQADSLASLAERDRGPDQGRLDRHMHALGQLQDEADEDLAEDIDRALSKVRAYRETVGGI